MGLRSLINTLSLLFVWAEASEYSVKSNLGLYNTTSDAVNRRVRRVLADPEPGTGCTWSNWNRKLECSQKSPSQPGPSKTGGSNRNGPPAPSNGFSQRAQVKVVDNEGYGKLGTHAPMEKLDIVISHFGTSLDWFEPVLVELKHLTSDVKVFIYTKSDNPLGVDIPGAYVERLPNVGREGHSYIYHILRVWDSLKEPHRVVFFLKDSTIRIMDPKLIEIQLPKTVTVATAHGMGCNGGSMGTLKKMDPNFTVSSYSPEHRQNKDDDKGFKLANPRGYRAWAGSHLQDLGALDRLDKAGHLCYGGIFAIKSFSIILFPKDMWERILNELSVADNTEAGHYMERMWRPLLGPR
mmetsp:Transcript_6133/g.12707  ORF Transcript_6133/g.12707 Transcript_6133/m.12707 type:complete len:351 (-) Transcript_6133:157-1209(-)